MHNSVATTPCDTSLIWSLQTRKGLYRLKAQRHTHAHGHTNRATQKYSRSHREPRNSSRTKIAAAAFLFTPILKFSFWVCQSLASSFTFEFLCVSHESSSPCTGCHHNYSLPDPCLWPPTLPSPFKSFILLPKTSDTILCPPLCLKEPWINV